MVDHLDQTIQEIKDTLLAHRDKKMCITSSFQTHSLPLLHLVTSIIPTIPVLFIDTGFHFPESYEFRNKICLDWDLNLVNVRSDISKHQQLDENNHFLYASNPEYCCHINKVVPLNRAMKHYNFWIAGLRRDQTKHRSNLESFVQVDENLTKYHPILEWNSRMIHEYREKHKLPSHPLEKQGYYSIGCLPCTKSASEEDRDSRWYGSNKTECGIHLHK